MSVSGNWVALAACPPVFGGATGGQAASGTPSTRISGPRITGHPQTNSKSKIQRLETGPSDTFDISGFGHSDFEYWYLFWISNFGPRISEASHAGNGGTLSILIGRTGRLRNQ